MLNANYWQWFRNRPALCDRNWGRSWSFSREQTPFLWDGSQELLSIVKSFWAVSICLTLMATGILFWCVGQRSKLLKKKPTQKTRFSELGVPECRGFCTFFTGVWYCFCAAPNVPFLQGFLRLYYFIQGPTLSVLCPGSVTATHSSFPLCKFTWASRCN